MKFRRLLCALWAAALLLTALPALAAEPAAFSDAGDIQHPQAVSAIVKLGLLSPKEGGTFDPQGPVTRGEAAKITAHILSGKRELVFAPRASGESAAFPDIQGHWAENYIELCARQGAAFPREDGSYHPNENATLFELLRMLEVALGEPASQYEAVENWVSLTHSLAQFYGLFTGLDNFLGKAILDHDLTREETAQLVYNALNATPRSRGSSGFYETVKRPDGSPSTLLCEAFGYGSWEEVEPLGATEPAQAQPADPTRLTDAAQVDHWEAVAALCRLGVVRGKDDGAFHPEDPVTRAECAKLMALLMQGGRDSDSGIHLDPTFSDTRGHWAESYIEFCADLAILSGRGDGRFDPDGPVTGSELCKMALAALGYDPAAYQLTGPQWAERTDQLSRTANPSLYTDLAAVELDRPISRDNAAQILYNALQVPTMAAFPDGLDGDGQVSWRFSPSDPLLKLRFGLDAVGPLPTQPGK